MEEIWKDIKGYEGRYQVSNMGNVRSMHYKDKTNPNIDSGRICSCLKGFTKSCKGFVWKYKTS